MKVYTYPRGLKSAGIEIPLGGNFLLGKMNLNVITVYRIVASRSTSWLVTCLGLFRLLMKGIFGPYVL